MVSKKSNLLIIPNTLATFGGGEHLAFDLYHKLGYKFDVKILNPISKKDLIRTEKSKLLKQYSISPKDIVDVKCRSFRMKTYGNEEFLFMIPTSEGLNELREAVKEADSIYGISQNPLILNHAVNYSNKFNTKYVFAIQNYLFSSFFDKSQGFKSNMQKWAYRRILNKIKYYHALNSYDAQLVKDNIPNAKPYLVPGFAEFKNNKLPFNKNEFTVLWVGRLDKYQKGVDLFCDVVEKVLAKETSIKFRVYGGGEDGEPLIKALVSRHGKNVEWPGFVPYAKVKEGYKDANLLAFTARGEELRYFPLVFLEGQALGLPIVVFDGKGYKGIITDNVEGSLIKPFNTDDFANAILKYYKIWKASKNDYIKLKKKISVLTKEKFGDEVIIPKMAKMLTPNDK